ncbi:MAG TPA: hypothetical protein VFJ14_06830 [Nocardioidaceae bacterium]|nr:hypothetical protein [Nocardioidaceae bacterium]
MTVATIEPSTGLATIEPGQNLITWARALGSAHQIATALCTTSFVPRHFMGKPEEAAAALMLGDELGLAPVSALRSIFVIGGTPGMYAKTMVALVQSRGHEVWTEAESTTKVTVCGRRAGTDHVEKSEWTIDRARRAGYTNNKKYETAPEDMLYARAAATVCRRIAADVLTGIPYAVEELELEETNKPKRTVTRKVKPTPPEPAIEATSQPATDEPAPTPEEPPLETGEAITKAQLTKLHTVLSNLGMGDADHRDEALAFYESVIGHPVESSKHLTKAEAGDIIDALEDREARPFEEPVDAEVVES